MLWIKFTTVTFKLLNDDNYSKMLSSPEGWMFEVAGIVASCINKPLGGCGTDPMSCKRNCSNQ